MESSAIVPDVGKAVDKRLSEIMRSIPAGMNTEKIFFQPDKVEDAISSFMWNLVESVAIVILVLIFTMGFRSGLIIGFGLILTVAVSFPILLVCGTTLQRISRNHTTTNIIGSIHSSYGYACGQCCSDNGRYSDR